MNDKDEQLRYLNYLQRQLVRKNSEPVLEKKKLWFNRFREDSLAALKEKKVKSDNPIKLIEKDLFAHQDKTENDCFFASNIFGPLVDELLFHFKEADIAPKYPIEFANSPSLDPSPAAYPSESRHYLFAGQGTFSYCNYWSKVFSTTLDEISSKSPTILTHEWLEMNLTGLPVIKLAKELSVHFSIFGSLIGFGKVTQKEELLGVRVLLLQAMEAFVISHEIAHFSMYETYPETGGVAIGASEKDLETECDALGFAISSVYGSKKENPFAFHFLGVIAFLYSLKISYRVQEIILNSPAKESDSHPAIKERIDAVFSFASKVSQHESLKNSMSEIKIISEVIEKLVVAEVVYALQSFD